MRQWKTLRGICACPWLFLEFRGDQRHYLYPGERVWTNPFIEGRYDFLIDAATLHDSRIYMHFYATGITPAMAICNVGKGSQYAIAYLDKDGNALDGSRTYKIHLPPNVRARDGRRSFVCTARSNPSTTNRGSRVIRSLSSSLSAGDRLQ